MEQVCANAQRTPLSGPRLTAHHMLVKMTELDDVEAYLQMFKVTAVREVWDKEQWAHILAPLLLGEPQQAYYALPANRIDDYDLLKAVILARVGLTPSFVWSRQRKEMGDSTPEGNHR
ncbi:MAG: hypothetical protein ACRC9V_14960 [Aeromonas sp.]